MEYTTLLSEKYEIIDGFLNMIPLDAVFIIEIFLRSLDQVNHNKGYMFAIKPLRNFIQRDLLLLENQLPFFILNKLYEKLCVETVPTILHLAQNYFRGIDQSIWGLDEAAPSSLLEQKHLKHFIDLI